METTTNASKLGTGKDVYTIITEKIIELLEHGTVPWQQPWYETGLPKNLISGRPYRGINIMLLASLGYEQNYFLTFRQLMEIGGKVKKDEKGHMVTYWNFPEKDTEATEEIDELQQQKKSVTLKYYTVFNVAQCENIPDTLVMPIIQHTLSCEDIVKVMPNIPDLRHNGNKAYYNPIRDYINLPKAHKVDDATRFRNIYHQLMHCTGHYSRLNRMGLIQMQEHGYDAFSHEELLAEIGTCYLQNHTGISSEFARSVDYIQGWLWKLKNDKRFIFSAASQAQKAVDYILNVQSETEEPKEE